MGYQSIYDQFRANGFTEAGALAMLGNFDCESNCIPYRVQGDFSSGYTVSKQYTADVDSGKISRQVFGSDQRGYGLAQWTYVNQSKTAGRKFDLYDFWKKRGASSIGDEAMQVDFSLSELKTDFSGLLTLLQTSNDLYECTKQVCYKYENPEYKNVDARFAAANRIKGEIDLDPHPVPPGPEPPDPPLEIFWPPRTIDSHCADWPEVTVLGSVLYCRGYTPYAITIWNDELNEAVRDFQIDNSLDPDCVVGPKTWRALLEM